MRCEQWAAAVAQSFAERGWLVWTIRAGRHTGGAVCSPRNLNGTDGHHLVMGGSSSPYCSNT